MVVTNEELVIKAQDGDIKALTKLIEQNDGLVKSVAKKYANIHWSFEDVKGDAYVGFLMAVKKFDPTRGILFSTVVTQYMTNYIRNQMRVIDKYVSKADSLDNVLVKSKGSKDILIEDLLGDNSTVEAIERNINNTVAREIFNRFLEGVSEREKLVAIRTIIYGQTQVSLAKELGVSQSAIQQTSAKVRRKLKIVAENYDFKL